MGQRRSGVPLRAWSTAAKREGSQIRMQLAHAGRQTQKWVNDTPKAPSAVPLTLPGIKFGIDRPVPRRQLADLSDRVPRRGVTAAG